jgi:hypothetical protein
MIRASGQESKAPVDAWIANACADKQACECKMRFDTPELARQWDDYPMQASPAVIPDY